MRFGNNSEVSLWLVNNRWTAAFRVIVCLAILAQSQDFSQRYTSLESTNDVHKNSKLADLKPSFDKSNIVYVCVGENIQGSNSEIFCSRLCYISVN